MKYVKGYLGKHIYNLYDTGDDDGEKADKCEPSQGYSQSYSHKTKLLNQAAGSSFKEQGPYTLQW